MSAPTLTRNSSSNLQMSSSLRTTAGSSNKASPSHAATAQQRPSIFQQRTDLHRSNITIMQLFPDQDMTVDPTIPPQEAMSAKLRSGYIPGSGPVEAAKHFNSFFKPMMNLRDHLEFDEDEPGALDAKDARAIALGNMDAIVTALISVLRRYRDNPQLRMITALKTFFRAVRTMSRLIRQRNKVRRTMLLDVVKWWDRQEADMKKKLDEESESPLFRIHHELHEIVEHKDRLSIAPEVKFAIVKLLYYRQRSKSAHAHAAWWSEVKRFLDPMKQIKAENERLPNGKYLEPFEGTMRELRRGFFYVCSRGPPAATFNRESVTFEELIAVRGQLAKLQSNENKKRLLVEFQDAVDSIRSKRRASHLAMETRREEEFRRRMHEKRAQDKEYEEVQQQRRDIMAGKKMRRISSVVISPRNDDDGGGDGDGGLLRVGSAYSRRASVGDSYTVEVLSDGDTNSPRTGRRGKGNVPCFVSDQREASDLSPLAVSGSFRQPRGSVSVTLAPSSRSLGGSSVTASFRLPVVVNTEVLPAEVAENPVAFLEKFGTSAFEESLKQKDQRWEEEMEAMEMDEDRRAVLQWAYRNKMTPTPTLEPFFQAPAGGIATQRSPSPSSTTSPRLLCFLAQSRNEEFSPNSGDATSTTPIITNATDRTTRVHVPLQSTVRIRPQNTYHPPQHKSSKHRRNLSLDLMKSTVVDGIIDGKPRSASATLNSTHSAPEGVDASDQQALHLTYLRRPTSSLMRPMSSGLAKAVSPFLKGKISASLSNSSTPLDSGAVSGARPPSSLVRRRSPSPQLAISNDSFSSFELPMNSFGSDPLHNACSNESFSNHGGAKEPLQRGQPPHLHNATIATLSRREAMTYLSQTPISAWSAMEVIANSKAHKVDIGPLVVGSVNSTTGGQASATLNTMPSHATKGNAGPLNQRSKLHHQPPRDPGARVVPSLRRVESSPCLRAASFLRSGEAPSQYRLKLMQIMELTSS